MASIDPWINDPIFQIRQSFADRLSGCGLEIGPGINPFPVGTNVHQIEYLDRYNQEEYIEHHPDHMDRIHLFPNSIDYHLDLESELLDEVLADRTFDFIIAANLIDQLNDSQRFQNIVTKRLNIKGYLIVVIPNGMQLSSASNKDMNIHFSADTVLDLFFGIAESQWKLIDGLITENESYLLIQKCQSIQNPTTYLSAYQRILNTSVYWNTRRAFEHRIARLELESDRSMDRQMVTDERVRELQNFIQRLKKSIRKFNIMSWFRK